MIIPVLRNDLVWLSQMAEGLADTITIDYNENGAEKGEFLDILTKFPEIDLNESNVTLKCTMEK